ncbi:HSP20-like chaperone [Mycena floridula]|nr:HSP20-like chaperone [Mycena floridula]
MRCTRRGCGQEFSENSQDPCVFHPGSPVFHEGLKSWSCCKDIPGNKPVLDFDEFMKLPGCMQTERHTIEALQVEPPPATASSPSSPDVKLSISESVAGQEVFTCEAPQQNTVPSIPAPAPAPIIEEEDDLTQPVPAGKTCRRKGCGTSFVSDEVSRLGDGEATICKYHSAPVRPTFFWDGYLCCKRRVLEFDEFLKIEGCKTGRHVFVPKPTGDDSVTVIRLQKEEMTTCRVDHYQTVEKVHVSIFAKQVDKERSKITVEDEQVGLDLYLPGSKRFVRTLDLFGPIDANASSYQIFGTKVELNLHKKDGRSWTVLEKTTQDLGNIALTFGVSGRTGTVGAKDVVLDATNQAKAV